MAFVFLIVCIVLAILLGLVVLIQNPKGGGVSSQFGGVSNQVFGASKSTDVVEKATWYLAGALLILCLSSGIIIKSANKNVNVKRKESSEVDKNLNKYKGPSQTNIPPKPMTPQPTAPTGK